MELVESYVKLLIDLKDICPQTAKGKALQASLLAYSEFVKLTPAQCSMAYSLIERNPTEEQIAETKRIEANAKVIADAQRKRAYEAKVQRKLEGFMSCIVFERTNTEIRRELLTYVGCKLNTSNVNLCNKLELKHNEHKEVVSKALYLKWEQLKLDEII